MKIVQVSTFDFDGGAGRAAYRLHLGLLMIGEDCCMLVKHKALTDVSVLRVTPKNSPKENDEEFFLRKVIQKYYIDSHRTDISNTIFSLPYPGYDLSGLPPVQTADIINLHWVADYYQSPTTLKKLSAVGKPIVWTLHDQWAFTGGCHYAAGCENYCRDCTPCAQLADDPLNLAAAVLKDKLELLRDANLTIVTPSRWLAACAKKSRLFKNTRVEVIPNSLETDILRPFPKGPAKKRLGLAADSVALLFVASYHSETRKGFPLLITAMEHCLSDPAFKNLVANNRIRLLCLGHANHEIKGLHIPTSFLGYLASDEAIRAAYSAADIFILPSLEDNLPNTLLEAMSCGTPVAAFDVGGVPDVVVNGVTGQLAAAGDIRQLGEAIISLVFKPDQREIMGQNCRKAMAEGYSLTTQAQRYLELYRELRREHEPSARAPSKTSTATLPQTDAFAVTSTEKALPVSLESALGPHFGAIFDQVLAKALIEYAPGTKKFYNLLKTLPASLLSYLAWKAKGPLRKADEIRTRLKG